MQWTVRTALCLLVLVAATSCTRPVTPGTAQPAPATAATTTTAPKPFGLPPRPRDIPLESIEPCSLLTAAQRTQLGLDGNPLPSTGTTRFLGPALSCDIRGSEPRIVALGITLATSTGVERLARGDLSADLIPTTINGFPAVVLRPTELTFSCSVEIDIAPGQLIDIQFRTAGQRPPIPQDQLCRDAQAAAAEVMATLLAR